MRNNTIHENISEDMLAADGGISLETLIRSKGLAISSLALDNQDVLILPGDGAVTTSQANVFSEYSKEVRALFNDVGIDAKLYDDGRDKRQLILKSADIVLPILLFIGSSAYSVGLGVLSNWINDNWVKHGNKGSRSVKLEYLEIDEHRKIKRWRKVEGPASLVSQVLAEEAKREADQASDAKTKGNSKRTR